MSWFDALTQEDRELIGRTLDAAINGPYLGDDLNFKILVGFDRSRARELLADWPQVSDSLQTWELARRSLADFWGYPHHMADEVVAQVGASTTELMALSERIGAVASDDRELRRALLRQQLAHYERLTDDNLLSRLAALPAIDQEQRATRSYRTALIRVADERGLPVSPDIRPTADPPTAPP